MKKENYFKIILKSSIFALFIQMNLFSQSEITSLNCYSFATCFYKGYYSKDPQTQIEYYSEALLLWKNADGIKTKAVAYNTRGNVYSDLKQYDKAIADYNKAIELDPTGECGIGKKGAAYYNRGLAYSGLKQYDKAISDYNKAIELNSGDAEAYASRGIINLVLGKKNEGISDLNKSTENYTAEINKNPNDSFLYNNRGWSYLWLDECEKAKSDFEKSIEIDKNFAYPYDNLGIYWWHCKKNKNKSLDYFEKAFEKRFSPLEWFYFYDETSVDYFIKDLNKTPEFKKLIKKYKNKQDSNQ